MHREINPHRRQINWWLWLLAGLAVVSTCSLIPAHPLAGVVATGALVLAAVLVVVPLVLGHERRHNRRAAARFEPILKAGRSTQQSTVDGEDW